MKVKEALRTTVIAGGLLATYLFCSGFIGGPKYVCEEKRVMAYPGDCFWSIADEYYLQNENTRYMCFEEYLYNVREHNKDLTNRGRKLQAGDYVRVPIYKVAPEK